MITKLIDGVRYSVLDEASDDCLAHYEDCRNCKAEQRCPEGERLVKRLCDIAAQQIAPMPKEAGRA